MKRGHTVDMLRKEDFYIVLKNMLASVPQVSEILYVKDARVPIMRFYTYARFNVIKIPELISNEGLVPSMEEIKRRHSVDKLRKVHSHESDVDALCVGPLFTTMAEDFFIVLKNMLASVPQVSEILCVKDARVPIMRFNFDGISIDLTYARLNVINIPEEDFFIILKNMLSSAPEVSEILCVKDARVPIMRFFTYARFNVIKIPELMNNEGLVPSTEEEIKRRHTVDKRGKVHSHESDVDALCVGPLFTTMAEDFFIVLKNMLASVPQVSEILCVKDARVPIMRFNFDGISIDLTYARLNVINIPENVDILGPLFLANIDDISWRSLSGVGAHKNVLHLVPNLEVYQQQQPLLLSLKFWANQGGIYGNALGSFGGIHLAVLAAFVCLKQPTASLNALIPIFLQTFAFWPWPTPVILEGGVVPLKSDDISREKILMPIQMPSSHTLFTRGTFNRIRKEFLHTYDLTKGQISASNSYQTRSYSKGRTSSLAKKAFKGLFKCFKCTETFIGRKGLCGHYKLRHKKTYSFGIKCKKCGAFFDTTDAQKNHHCVFPSKFWSVTKLRDTLKEEIQNKNRGK